MSTDYKHSIEVGSYVLSFNFHGISAGSSSSKDLKLAVYAYNKSTGAAVFNQSLEYEQAVKLFRHLGSISIIKDSSLKVTGNFIEVNNSTTGLIGRIKTLGEDAVVKLLKSLDEDTKTLSIIESLSEKESLDISISLRHRRYKKSREHLKELIELDSEKDFIKRVSESKHLSMYKAGQPEKILQNWIISNLWVFGIQYSKKYDIRKISIHSEADILVESLDGFLDLIEVKRPSEGNILHYDKSHDSYFPTAPLSKAIGQGVHYMSQLDDSKLLVEKENNVKLVRPRVKIIIGRSDTLDANGLSSLRMINSSLVGVEIYTYDYLLACADRILSILESDSEDLEIIT